ncbi:electron transport complex subunit RsxC [Vibrio nitrifigilis]|uniref:Ion-translocating oxidoreductase complex subunit C n=1 Tax=Vibrio nitrifigilis TaxID=2789781 RepID=A0ABS0GBT8_9VIBR|nr:electron transport complex subunit RsxC [Vibrio nitrifigilis]MBF8999841.1 electron transport complex subunit RsxC [Vibrio nitrifigilis]
MLSLIEQIKSGKIWDFPGGIHPPENKKQSTKTPLTEAKIPDELILPLKQHIGRAGDLLVEPGMKVLKGQPLTRCNTAFTVPVHAPTSGIITAIEPRTVAHPSGLAEPCIVIQPDFAEQWTELFPQPNYRDQSPLDLIELVRKAGISGMGGAGFPTARKIESGQSKIDILIVNAAECEPYITADDALMREYADEIISGIQIVEHILAPKLTIIGIEDNKPQAVAALEKAAQGFDNIVIRVVPTKYPSGGAKQLIKILTNLEVPSGGRSSDIGQMVMNVGTIQAIKRAIIDGEPLIRRVVTLTGKAFKRPQNVWALLGTPIQSLLDEFGYKEDKKLPRLIMGGPLMGFTLPHAQVPITKIANCILAPTRREISPAKEELACIRCSACADACPASLLPQQLYWHAKAEEYEKCESLDLKDCIECGACAYVCPSDIPLVQYYRQAKAEIRTRRIEAEAAERAKQRFEEKKARMERDKAERENRFKKAAENRRAEMTKSSGGDDAVAAAIARVKAQKSQAANEPQVKPAVAAAIAKAKAKQAEAMQNGAEQPDNSEMTKLREERKRQARERKAKAAQEQPAQQEESDSNGKKDAVAAAIARAKARKAAQQAEPTDVQPDSESVETDTAQDPKKAAVAAAIARAKARKAAQQTEATDVQPDSESVETDTAQDPKKAAVAAAIARAKARKAAQQAEATDVQPDSESVEPDAAQDPKKAAVTAAIARAKARKAAQQAESTDVHPDSESVEPDAAQDPKKAAVAAAIARAKARKAAQQAEATDVQPDSESVEADTEPDPKKAAVAAAIARAKARKAARENEIAAESAEDTTDTAAEEKTAAVASAVAKAKARKVEQERASIKEHDTSGQDDPKKAAVAAAIARAKARKVQKEQNDMNDSEENN